MQQQRFLILGANGQLGRALQAQYPEARVASRQELDITDTDSLQQYDWSAVDVIINAAAYTQVDAAEADGRQASWQANAAAVGNLATIARAHDLTLVHISTDYVFDGTQDIHTEDEPFSPINVYGSSKAAGDIAAATTPKHYLLRVSWVIGEGANFVRTMISLAERDISPSVVADQIGRLTFTGTIVAALDHLLQTHASYGTYNVSNSGDPTSWADITRAIFADLGRDDLTVTDTTAAAYYAGKPGIAPRPLQSTLNLDKLIATGFTPREWRSTLQEYIQAEQAAAKEQ
jgi:dTDP-4-dehydrorhamnose 3,5-epimerase/reductase